MNKEEILRRLGENGIQLARSLGQNFLIDERVVKRQIDYAHLTGEETVLEIGPGLGVLTTELVRRAGRVVAIEKDIRLARILADELRENGLLDKCELRLGDAVKVDLGKFDKVVSNLPYQISSPITFKLLDYSFELAILMYQLEFAKRLVAKVGTDDYSRLTVNLYYKAEARILEKVPRSAFFPMPNVDSAIVELRAREHPPFEVIDENVFKEVVNAIFTQRRKKVKNGLLSNWKKFTNDRSKLEFAIVRLLPHMDSRAEELSPEEIACISNAIVRRV